MHGIGGRPTRIGMQGPLCMRGVFMSFRMGPLGHQVSRTTIQPRTYLQARILSALAASVLAARLSFISSNGMSGSSRLLWPCWAQAGMATKEGLTTAARRPWPKRGRVPSSPRPKALRSETPSINPSSMSHNDSSPSSFSLSLLATPHAIFLLSPLYAYSHHSSSIPTHILSPLLRILCFRCSPFVPFILGSY